MVILYGRCSKDEITLESALENCASVLSEGVAIIYSPICCQLAKVNENGELKNKNNEVISLNGVFELRAFNKTHELRWLNKFDGEGKAVLISEQPISSYLDKDICDLEALNIIPQEYILWGEGVTTVSPSGWGKLAKSRIGSIDVPVEELTVKKRVYLDTVEYLKADEYGNVSVVEERLIGLSVK
jgi:CRISPR-associated protein (TIGR03984 family)